MTYTKLLHMQIKSCPYAEHKLRHKAAAGKELKIIYTTCSQPIRCVINHVFK